MIDGNFYSMHHMEDGQTIIPVLQTKHSAVGHTGGGAIIRNNLQGFFAIN